METFTFIVSDKDEKERLDKYLSSQMPNTTRSFLQKLIKEKNVLVNGQVQKSNYKLKSAQTVLVSIPPAESIAVVPEDLPLDILYEDEDILIVNKPKGMVVHPANRKSRWNIS